ncbi:DUF6479 family protein [Yinghuangia seranimata]|uniref:DUF6479 family protein n=1 Tax=Yinghuangia seranimata TaxID=408067 RepID=UPI00248CD3E0|nr:DUF6479 family protein [Yinghuangia seranimata]MDI2125384.1 DUF6479 family protein [Yinghuangia seranimata]
MTSIDLAGSAGVGLVTAALAAIVVIAALLSYPVLRGVRERRFRPPPDYEPRSDNWGTADSQETQARRFEHDTEREPIELPHDGTRLFPHEMEGFGNLTTRPKRKHPEE